MPSSSSDDDENRSYSYDDDDERYEGKKRTNDKKGGGYTLNEGFKADEEGKNNNNNKSPSSSSGKKKKKKLNITGIIIISLACMGSVGFGFSFVCKNIEAAIKIGSGPSGRNHRFPNKVSGLDKSGSHIKLAPLNSTEPSKTQ